LVVATLVCALGVGAYFVVDQRLWVGWLLVGHSVLSLTVLLTSLPRGATPDLKGLAFA
jgi:hypothetical protein